MSEVLITIAIIGIVAALTIPGLIIRISMTQYKSAYKKNYSMIAQATKEICDDNGGTMISAFEDIPFDGWNNIDKMMEKYSQYLHIIKQCRTWENVGHCFPPSFKYLNGSPAVGTGITLTDMLNTSGGSAGAMLNDSTSLAFSYLDSSCNWTSALQNNICGYIMIDVNGFKNPNVWGKDIYGVHILKDGTIKPFGNISDEARNTTCIENDSGANNIGLQCSFKYLVE